jgi:hypothetical protein
MGNSPERSEETRKRKACPGYGRANSEQYLRPPSEHNGTRHKKQPDEKEPNEPTDTTAHTTKHTASETSQEGQTD